MKVVQVEHIASLSDHCGIVMELELQDVTTTRIRKKVRETYWKLNAAILRDEEFLGNFADFWNRLQSLKPRYSDIADWWDLAAKPNIKEFCILFSTRRSNRMKDTKKF